MGRIQVRVSARTSTVITTIIYYPARILVILPPPAEIWTSARPVCLAMIARTVILTVCGISPLIRAVLLVVQIKILHARLVEVHGMPVSVKGRVFVTTMTFLALMLLILIHPATLGLAAVLHASLLMNVPATLIVFGFPATSPAQNECYFVLITAPTAQLVAQKAPASFMKRNVTSLRHVRILLTFLRAQRKTPVRRVTLQKSVLALFVMSLVSGMQILFGVHKTTRPLIVQGTVSPVEWNLVTRLTRIATLKVPA